MNEGEGSDPARQRYEDALVRAMHFAERHLHRDQALEIAHEVATKMLQLPAERVSTSLIYVAVTSRLRNYWRSRERRASAEGAYQQMWSSATRLWVEPDAEMEIRELQDRIRAVLADMPPRMHEVFILIRDEELTYKEAAARLGISVKTVHTQICRAGLLLRECVARYHADAPRTRKTSKDKSQ
jgi:RNA polymerase sigma-70 factor (ECF subfamily)